MKSVETSRVQDSVDLGSAFTEFIMPYFMNGIITNIGLLCEDKT